MTAPLIPSVPQAGFETGRSLRLREAWAVVVRRARLIVLCAAVVTAFAALYVAQIRTQYTASAEIMLDPRKSSVENSAGVLSNLPADQPTILNQIEILSSHRFAGKIVDRLHLAADPQFTAQGFAARLFPSETDPRERAIDRLRKSLKVAQAGFSSTIRLSVTAADRPKALKIAAAMAALYVEGQLETKAAASRQASGWLTGRVNELALKVKEAEAAVQKYKAEHNITVNAAGASTVEQQITDLNAQLTAAQTDFDAKAANAARIQALARAGDIASAPQVVSSPLIAAMRTQQTELNREIANLTARYGPNHPKMKELSAQRTDLESKIAAETQRIAGSLRAESDTAAAHVASLRKTLRETEQLNARKNQEVVELAGLQSAALSARAIYQAFLTQYSQTENQQGILRPDADVISASDVEETFGAQTKLLAVLSAIPAGLLIGLALAFATDQGHAVPKRDGTAKLPAPARLKATAILPEAGPRAADLVLSDPASPYARAVSGLLTSLLADAAPPMTVAIAAEAPGAGKTALALSLARAAAVAGIRTIVIDANRGLCHLGTLAGGLKQQTSYKGTAEDFLTRDPYSAALLMSANPGRPGYDQLLAPQHLGRLIAHYKASIDLVLVAAPPFGDGLAQLVLTQADVIVNVTDARRPLRPLPLPPGRSALTVITHAL